MGIAMNYKRIGIIAGGVLVLVVGALVVIPQLVPSDVYRSRIETAATQALGREVKVTGDIKLSIFPRIEARAGATTIANPEGFGDAPFASMNELRAAVALWPLLFRKVEIDEFVLVEPNIALVSLEDGRNNWTFDIGKPAPGPVEPDAPPQPTTIGASLGDVRIVNGTVSWDDRIQNRVQTVSELDLRARMQAIDKPFDIDAKGLANALPFDIDARIENPKAMLDGVATKVDVGLKTEVLNTKLDGMLALGAAPEFDFSFEGDTPSLPALAEAFQVTDLPARNVLGRVSASGQAYGTPKDITLKIVDARHEGELLNADFNGEMRVAEFVTLALTANAEAPRLADLAAAMNIEAPVASALGKATATTKVTGPLGDLQFTDVNFRHDSGLLALGFDGSARLQADLTYDGRVSIAAPDLRALADAAGAKLPPGDVYRNFSLTGQTSGSTRDLKLRNAVVEFDDVRGEGEAALSFGGRPKLVASLTTGLIDITPYALASGAPEDREETEKGWSKEPIDLTPLRLADADLSIKAQGLKFQKFDFGASNVVATLLNGKLTADLKQTSLFGGAGGAMLIADGSGATPSVAFKANIKGLGLEPLLAAAAGFDMLQGAGDLQVEIAGAGGTLESLMNSLAGNGSFAFRDGLLEGVDLMELGRAAQTALSTRSIPLSAFGANASTKFNGLNASFSMKDGVAAMSDMKLEASQLTVSGGGALNIGDQTLSLSLYPEFKDRNAGVKGYGLPVKLSGGWTGVNLSLDFDWLVQRATADARARVTNEIEEELREQLGDGLSGLLGISGRGTSGSQTPAAQPAPAQPSGQQAAPEQPPQQPAEEQQPQSAEDLLRREAEKALGGLFKRD
jgi:AsmA protein